MLRPAKSSHAMTSRSAGLFQPNASTIARANCKSVNSLYAQVDCVAADQVTVGPADLVFLSQITVADSKNVELVSHETAERVLRRAHDGLAAHIEARIHEDRTASFPLERGEQRVIAWIGVLVHGLDAGRVINMRHGRDVGAGHV